MEFLYSKWNKLTTGESEILGTFDEVSKDRKKWYTEQEKRKTKESQA